MVNKFEKILPVGIPVKKELSGIAAAIGLAVLRSLVYFSIFSSCYENLFDYYHGKKTLITSRRMEDFYIIVEDCFEGFAVVIFLLIALCIYHYVYHYRESKSIYLMKRLPKKSELYKRCITVPLISIVICIVLTAALLFIYYRHYMTVTPPECLTDGQFEKFLADLIGTDWVTVFTGGK